MIITVLNNNKGGKKLYKSISIGLETAALSDCFSLNHSYIMVSNCSNLGLASLSLSISFF